MSKLSIDNALNVLGIPVMPLHQPALEEAYQKTLALYSAAADHPGAEPLYQLLKAAHEVLQSALCAGKKGVASDPEYAHRLSQAFSWIVRTPLSFEILGAWLWVNGQKGLTAIFEAELEASGLEWASKKACWYLKPKTPPLNHELKRESWDLDRIRSTYAHRLA